MTPEQFGLVERLFFKAAELPPDEQAAFLDRACADNDIVRAEVEGLLKQHGKSGGVATAPLAGAVEKAIERVAIAAAADSSERALKLVGSTVGAYKITGVLAGGGMGVVYAGRDTRLGRAVAVKAVMPAFTDDPVWLARFHREARILASLNHPNVATVFGLEEFNGRRYLVMEMLEGVTLAERLAKGPLSIPEALQVAAHVAAGVQAAHEEDVVHRDLKPANVMLLADGRLKVLDFGLAREVDGVGGTNAGTVPILPIHGVSGQQPNNETRHGAVIGTPGYMSPEQVRGQRVDRRTDVFSFGCVLYECLTGRVAFPGSSGADIIVGILERDPDWSLLPPRTPASVVRLLRRCCMKDASQRLRDMADVRLALEDALYEREWQVGPAGAANAGGLKSAARRRRILLALPWLLLAGVVALAVSLRRPGGDGPPDALAGAPAPASRRFAVAFPNGQVQDDLSHVRVALSRDGSQLVCSASDGRERHLWLLPRDETALRKIDGTLDAWLPSFSPDGTEILYFDAGAMRRRRLAGGNAMTVVDVAGYWGDYDWGTDDVVSFVPYWTNGVARVAVGGGGGRPTFATRPDYAAGEAAHVGPVATRGGSGVIYTVWDGKSGTRIDAVDLATKTQRNVVRDGLTPRLAHAGGAAYLLWSRNGTVFAAAFDEKSLRLAGPETPIVDGVMTDEATFNACYDAADDGTLAYVAGPSFSEESRLGWLDAGAEAEPQPMRSTHPFGDQRMSFVQPRFTADGKKLSVIVKGDVYRPYVCDVDRGSFERIVIDGDDASSAISPDGKRLAYSTNKEGPYALWLRDLATGREQRLHEATAEYHAGVAWSADGRFITFAMPPDTNSRRDVWVLNVLEGGARRFCEGPADQRAGEFSPNGKWLAYVSDELGRREVYVRAFPDAQRNLQISADGGDWPQWSPSGDRLYFRSKGKLYSAGFSPDEGPTGGRATLEYDRKFGQSDFDLPDYTVAPDGRLLLVEPSDRAPTASSITVVLNWPSLLKSSRQ
jgi:hypothetical protein